jgi:hypothetical protein
MQAYRHCDSISMSLEVTKAFYASWFQKDPKLQRAAILFGRVGMLHLD